MKLQIPSEEQKLRNLAMGRLILRGVRVPQTWQITEEVKKIAPTIVLNCNDNDIDLLDKIKVTGILDIPTKRCNYE